MKIQVITSLSDMKQLKLVRQCYQKAQSDGKLVSLMRFLKAQASVRILEDQHHHS